MRNLFLQQVFAIFIEFVGGGIIGFNISLSLSLLNLLIKGYYRSDWIFHDTFYAFFLGIPIGGLVMILFGCFLREKGIKFNTIAILLALGIGLTILLSNYLDQRLRPPIVRAAQLNQVFKIQSLIQKGINWGE